MRRGCREKIALSDEPPHVVGGGECMIPIRLEVFDLGTKPQRTRQQRIWGRLHHPETKEMGLRAKAGWGCGQTRSLDVYLQGSYQESYGLLDATAHSLHSCFHQRRSTPFPCR